MSDQSKLRTAEDVLRDPRPGDAVKLTYGRVWTVVDRDPCPGVNGGAWLTLVMKEPPVRKRDKRWAMPLGWWRRDFTDAEVLHVAKEGGEE